MTADPRPVPFDLRNKALAAAHRLLRDLRSGEPPRAAAAAARFRRLRPFADHGGSAPERVRLKHALAVVAEEHGHRSWVALKNAVAAAVPPYHAPAVGGFLNRWFVDPDEARASRELYGGYLLPFREQCFVGEAELVRALGLDPDDPDWSLTGFDLVRPRDAAAAERLHQRRRAALRAGIAVPPPTPVRRRR